MRLRPLRPILLARSVRSCSPGRASRSRPVWCALFCSPGLRLCLWLCACYDICMSSGLRAAHAFFKKKSVAAVLMYRFFFCLLPIGLFFVVQFWISTGILTRKQEPTLVVTSNIHWISWEMIPYCKLVILTLLFNIDRWHQSNCSSVYGCFSLVVFYDDDGYLFIVDKESGMLIHI
jgi:hypothetical protein